MPTYGKKYVGHYFNCVTHCQNIVASDGLDQNQNSVFTEVAQSVLWGKESLGGHYGFSHLKDLSSVFVMLF